MILKACSISPRTTPYDRSFFFCYAANTAMLVAVSLLFRYEDFVREIGGTVFHLGVIVGTGTTGAILMRMAQGVAIDRLGAKWIWLACLGLYGVSIVWHLQISNLGLQVFCARILMNTSLAGAFGSSIAYVSLRSPPGRVAETVGMLGTSGFVGMAIGPVIGDWLFANDDPTDLQIQSMFYACLIAIGLAIVLVLFSGNSKRSQTKEGLLGVLMIVRDHQPGFLLVVGMAMGLGISLPHSFLRPYVKELGIDELKTFFLCYTIVAFVVRILTRKLPDLWGFRLGILIGLSCLALSMPAYLLVNQTWTLIIPATIAGVAHAFLFPSVIAAACESFPEDHRGIATSIILGMFDAGVLIGAPLVGSLLMMTESAGIASYPTMFVFVGGLLAMVAISYYRLDPK
jgi:MFS family permease